ncbi:Protein sprouty 3 [Lonchura striata]|uniref:Protein sprouty 3 n=1 Tax=Lonchura striata TaxID=40157 RepID=A0A218UCN2_9PASE|nr:protein sprouty homolog 3 [Lonchura striata domestica]XP_021399905.1 protein sprouty homolog 3 [Lonchura striata domestica]XP_021399906.1 protein sprouty homolog 3 [Lonchura striata domestica]OWK51469.1 Protein sprouty 3 [Lonchura striata domestica]
MQLSSSVAELSCDETMDPPAEDFQQVLSIDQIRSIRASNNYVERPAACFQQARSNPSLSQPPHKQEWSQDRLASSTFQDLHRSHSQQHQVPPVQPHLSHSSTASSVSQSTTASEQRLLSSLTPSHSGHSLVRTQPRGAELKAEESPRKGAEQPAAHGHLLLCEACGRCRCPRCTAARSLPSCWLCNQRCLCSAESLLDYGTCLCCVKGLFYHCSTDDEDTCADDPCSCGPGSCCARWAAMSVLSLLLPCLCCYFPTLGCLKLCQRGYDGLKRPGCRCQSHTNTVCRKISSASGTPFPKTLDKPV